MTNEPNIYSLETQELIERLIDKHGVGEVLRSIGILCGDKADHIRASYNDYMLGKCWNSKAKAIFAFADRMDSYERG